MAQISKEEVLALKGLVTDSLAKILKFAGYDDEAAKEAKETIKSYIGEKDDEKKRELRKSLNNMFFVVYRTCVLNAIQAQGVPMPVIMFLLFGYMDEELAGIANAIYLAKFTEEYDFNPDSGVKSLYEWLNMIYNGKKMPSVNDMSVDYEADLREKLKFHEITQSEYDGLMHDRQKKFLYEVNNAISIMKRVSGSPTRFLAIFEGNSLEYPLNTAYLTNEIIDEELDKIINTDVNLFSHEYTYANKAAGLDNVRITKEIRPDIIVLPIIGARPMMWQEIEGRNRQTPARFFFPRFLNGDLRDWLIKCCGSYRWEFCKREQGARWQDISDPSLCAYFYNYIQTYKKNHHISQEQKEKITAQYNKYRHNVREIFVEDYTKYIKNEAEGNIRLNKLSREILLRFCILNKDIRAELVKNALYTANINVINNKIEHDKKQLIVMKKRIEDNKSQIPPEIREYEILINR